MFALSKIFDVVKTHKPLNEESCRNGGRRSRYVIRMAEYGNGRGERHAADSTRTIVYVITHVG